ncbi:RNA polymerase sigma factor [Mongoliitalea daihaiensis]|uniref:RNA polymerase sigma factor n=1 Tax=Mongoliitalea daihaiensis TaxID=2782006 RepID=UPI001F3BADD1|nr:RNA polymerase sigma factor [Mongoliitalea daihaiensis]UJP65104.1 RNA polymerase sigma factor [Mongoliitalea daihaiensis]
MTEQDFNQLYHAYAPKVHRLCLGYSSGDLDLANEWLQETFIKVWNHRNAFRGDSSIDTWIYRIATNICLGDIRKIKKQVIVKEELLTESITEEPVNDEGETIEKMYSCISQLSEQNRTLILMELENIPQETIAASVGLAHGTLRTRLSRIRKSLLNCIKHGI